MKTFKNKSVEKDISARMIYSNLNSFAKKDHYSKFNNCILHYNVYSVERYKGINVLYVAQ